MLVMDNALARCANHSIEKISNMKLPIKLDQYEIQVDFLIEAILSHDYMVIFLMIIYG